MESYFLPYPQLQPFLQNLQQAGYRTVGPQVRNGAIVYDTLNHADQLPWGIRDRQMPGSYTLESIAEKEAFAFSNGPQAIKPLLFKPKESLWQVKRDENGKLQFISVEADEKPIAIIGARACDLAGMAIQDKVFLQNAHQEPRYAKRRQQLFVVAVNCSYSSNNCFCVSAGTGPAVKDHYDILLKEVENGFVIEAGSTTGEPFVKQLKLNKAAQAQIDLAAKRNQNAADSQTKQIPLNNSKALRDVLFNNLNHPRWKEVAERCLSCGNCVESCPTCFCHSEIEKPQLDGNSSEHQREWDSCFTAGHSYMGHQVLRDTTEKRYRQWLTHKVGSWHDQFDVSGCVGCGRCITWCPVGIDLTEELAAITGEDNVKSSA
jgi:ferredoxin